ncbi:flavin-binding monooxygenase-like protein-like protein [Dendryphion nanum]|uniref:Flavin-binding monooxygenase-like protein-like protein n=1 Tax=Dendryphion nanum TaxID=256645 RepID=A0A9P9DXE0_9PLEO|nr:flavin-binding monooxygenase-like protein-like protein [Dendryphion nanum]
MESRQFDLVIVGAGLSGIISAQRYLDVHPSADIAILEKEQDVGGVFTKRRGFDNFWTQWTSGLSGFSDHRMRPPSKKDSRNDFYKSAHVTEYLEDYVERESDERRLRDRIFFNLHVYSIAKVSMTWSIKCVDTKGIRSMFSSPKIIIATGLSSLPYIPAFIGKDMFGAPIIHSFDFGAHLSLLRASPSTTRITVLGSGKSSVDMVYECAKSGKKVDWIIRISDNKPSCLRRRQSTFQATSSVAHTRFVSAASPSIFSAKTALTQFLHQNTIGNRLLRSRNIKVKNKFRKEARKHVHKRCKSSGPRNLDYDAPLFWEQNHPDFPLIAKYVTIHFDDVASLAPGHVRLASGKNIPCDTMLCGTGWKPGLSFFDNETLIRLGLPHDLSMSPRLKRVKWAILDSEAERQVLKKLPLLAESPTQPSDHDRPLTPYRLYQGIAPISDASILFISHLHAGNKIFSAEAQAMWAVALFDGNIKLPSVAEMERSVAQWVAYIRRRYSGSALLGNNITMDTVPYADRLLDEMGLKDHRRGKGWRRYWFEPVGEKDLGRAWKEYLSKYAEKKA